MKSNMIVAACVLGVSALLATAAQALTVANPSFEILPDSGLPYPCGTACSYSSGPIPGWNTTGVTGQFQPGPPANTAYFNSVPDGITVAYSNGGEIYQTVVATAQAGVTYTLKVERGERHDLPNPDIVWLGVGTNQIFATGVGPPPGSGDWATYTAVYTALAADDGKAISIHLASGVQGDWDNVRLTATPLPAALPMFAAGLGVMGLFRWRRKRTQVAAAAL